jgi:hypothetical protein
MDGDSWCKVITKGTGHLYIRFLKHNLIIKILPTPSCHFSLTTQCPSRAMTSYNSHTQRRVTNICARVCSSEVRSLLLSSSIKTFLQVYWHMWPPFLRLGNIKHFHFCVHAQVYTPNKYYSQVGTTPILYLGGMRLKSQSTDWLCWLKTSHVLRPFLQAV